MNKSRLVLVAGCVVLAIVLTSLVLSRQRREVPAPPPTQTSGDFATNAVHLRQPPTLLVEDPRPSAPPPPQDEIVGIGAIIRKDRNTGNLLIVGAAPDSPAAAAGLSGNFVIRKIDEVIAEGLGLQDCIQLIRGPAGTSIRLELLDTDANEIRQVTLIRQKIELVPPR